MLISRQFHCVLKNDNKRNGDNFQVPEIDTF